ncbi:MAG: hypothetical protein HUU57_10530 [Bdellovibrio sp.]|nr:hypothetical protein [Bdellovibrio sp.]
MKLSVLKLTLTSSLLVLLAACQQIANNSLLTDQKDDSSAHALDKTPKVEELYLKAYTASIQATNLDKVEVAGECYTSTFPRHAIFVLKNNAQIDIVDVNPATANNTGTASCKNGRFNLVINSGALASGVHSLRLVIQAWDANNQVVVNDMASNTVTLSK